jgi:flavin-binding protein dodecin
MSDKVYKKVRVVGCSDTSYEDAIKTAVAKTTGSVRGVAWWEVVELRGAIREDGTFEWQATIDVSFKVE